MLFGGVLLQEKFQSFQSATNAGMPNSWRSIYTSWNKFGFLGDFVSWIYSLVQCLFTIRQRCLRTLNVWLFAKLLPRRPNLRTLHFLQSLLQSFKKHPQVRGHFREWNQFDVPAK